MPNQRVQVVLTLVDLVVCQSNPFVKMLHLSFQLYQLDNSHVDNNNLYRMCKCGREPYTHNPSEYNIFSRILFGNSSRSRIDLTVDVSEQEHVIHRSCIIVMMRKYSYLW